MAAFIQRTAVSVADSREGPDSYGIRSVLTKSDVLAALSVPVELEVGPIGTLDLYSAKPRELEHRSLVEVVREVIDGKPLPGRRNNGR